MEKTLVEHFRDAIITVTGDNYIIRWDVINNVADKLNQSRQRLQELTSLLK